MCIDNLALLAEVGHGIRGVPGSTPTGNSVLQFCFTFQCAFSQAKPMILEKTLNRNYPVLFDHRSHMIQIDLAIFVLKSVCVNRCAMRYFALLSVSFKTIYTRFDGFSTPVISFWLICTTRRWDRGSIWGHHTLFLSELIFC